MSERNHLPTFPIPFLTTQFIPETIGTLQSWVDTHAPPHIRILWEGHTAALDLIQEANATPTGQIHLHTWQTTTTNIGNALHILHGCPITYAPNPAETPGA